jgi:hypothetical protein
VLNICVWISKTFTLVPHSTDTNTCGPPSRYSPNISSSTNTSCATKIRMATCTSNAGKPYSLPQAGVLANTLLKARLAPAGYYKVPHTPGLWNHISRPISFTLVVDDFGVQYVGQQHADHLVRALKREYQISEDWTGGLYFGITLSWDYAARTVHFSMPGYIQKQLKKYQHEKPTRPQHSPYPSAPRT